MYVNNNFLDIQGLNAKLSMTFYFAVQYLKT